MSYSVAKEDIEAIQKKNFRVIFAIGPPGSGIEENCKKLVTEYKYKYISIKDLLTEEKNNKSKIGDTIINHESRGKALPQDLIYNILIRAFVSKKAHTFLVSGFPHSLDQALYVEKFIKEIKVVINFENSPETSISREHVMSKENFDEAELLKSFENYKEITLPVIEFYQKYGVVRTINSDMTDNQIYESLKENLFPEVYCVIGKKYSGKTALSKVLSERSGMKCINFPAFLKEPLIAKKANDDEYVIKQFIARLREEESKRVLVEDFPMKREHYTIFVQNCKPFRKLFYLNAQNNECSERMRNLGLYSPEFIGCSELNNCLTDFEKKMPYIEFLRKKCGENFLEFNVNKVFKLVVEDVMNKIAPNILVFKSDSNGSGMQETLIQHFKEKLNYQIIDVKEILKEYSSRNHTLGSLIEDAKKTGGKLVPNSLKIEALKPILFNENNNKFILINYPDSQESVIEFEEKICKILRYVYVSKNHPLDLKLEKSEIEIYFKKNNRFFNYNQEDIHDYIIDDILGANRDFNIAYGLPFAGDSLINGHLEKNYRHKLIDLVKFIEQIKITKAGPDGTPEDIVVDLPMLLSEFKTHLAGIPKNQKICIENLLNPVIVDYDGAAKFMEILGKPRFFFEIFCNDAALLDKYKAKNEIAEDLSEDQKAEFDKSLEIPKKIIELLKDFAYKTIKVDTSFSEWKSLNNFDFNFGRNLIVIKHDYSINIENCLYMIAASNKILYINVPYLIYKQFYLKNSWADRLENCYDKKNLKLDNFDDFERKIYRIYNPLHFQESVVNELIMYHINENSKENEDNDNMVILTGYINFDLLKEDSSPYNLPMYEIKKLLNIGYMMNFIYLSNKKPQVEETEEAILLEAPKPKEKEKKEGVEGEEGEEGEMEAQQDEPPQDMEGEEGKPKFKPEGFCWTDYDGDPRNHVQVVSRFTKYPVKECDTTLRNLENSLVEILYEDIKTKEGKIHLVNY